MNDIVHLYAISVTHPALPDSLVQGMAAPSMPTTQNDGGTEGRERRESPAIFALRTTVAALLAVALARVFGVQHPWWAAMTVWLVAQPTRGLLLERSLARLIGSAVGAAAGAAMLLGLGSRPLPSLLALALWLALCSGFGSLYRHFRNYGFVIAGCTAAIIVLPGLSESGHDAHLAVDRILCTMIGIAFSALATIPGLPRGRDEYLAVLFENTLQRCLDRIEQHLRHARSSIPAQELVAEIGALNRNMDNNAAGSLRSRRAALRIRRISEILLELIILTPESGKTPDVAPSTGSAGERADRLALLAQHLDQLQSNPSALRMVLDELRTVLRGPIPETGYACRDIDVRLIIRAAARPVVALAIAALFWLVSGWVEGPTMAMTATLFASLFSAHGQGNQALIQVLMGSLLGALGGIAARLLLLPHASGLWAMLLCIAPLLLLGAWLMRRPSTAKMAIDLNMTFLLTDQPSSSPADAAMVPNPSGAIIAGVFAAVATYWLFLPSSREVHQRVLGRRMARIANAVSHAPDAHVGKSAHHSLRATFVRLQDFCMPDDAVFLAAQQCLAQSRLMLVGLSRKDFSHGRFLRPPSRPLPSSTAARKALHAARTTLVACLDP
ncbi:hypothetical protein EHZ19_31085 [Paraburkholderia bannensis]|nr:FUSC family protein [Paraburkholderia bannensis]RQM44000.1 hypothetical protein EHZ19_31085 [Paraburkholderia bannensis]